MRDRFHVVGPRRNDSVWFCSKPRNVVSVPGTGPVPFFGSSLAPPRASGLVLGFLLYVNLNYRAFKLWLDGLLVSEKPNFQLRVVELHPNSLAVRIGISGCCSRNRNGFKYTLGYLKYTTLHECFFFIYL